MSADAAGRHARIERKTKETEITIHVNLDGTGFDKSVADNTANEITKLVPTNAYLSNFRFRDQVLEVQGNAENASALIPVLERSPLFENVGFTAPSNRGRDNRETFSLKAILEKAKIEKAVKADEKAAKPLEKAVKQDEKAMKPNEKAVKADEKAVKPAEKTAKP